MTTMRMNRPPAVGLPTEPGRPRGTLVVSPKSVRGFSYQWIDTTTVNPILEQPRLVLNSAAQPFTRWGHRRYVRTHMTATPRFSGRFAFVGTLMNRFLERNRIAGVQSRPFTYSYPIPTSAPAPGRVQQLRAGPVGR